eukprot:6121178-Prymnesium_polylepis.1
MVGEGQQQHGHLEVASDVLQTCDVWVVGQCGPQLQLAHHLRLLRCLPGELGRKSCARAVQDDNNLALPA